MPEYKEELLKILAAVPDRLRRTIAGLTEDELNAHPVKGKWSIREYVKHIVSVHLGWTDIFCEAVCPFFPELRKHPEPLGISPRGQAYYLSLSRVGLWCTPGEPLNSRNP